MPSISTFSLVVFSTKTFFFPFLPLVIVSLISVFSAVSGSSKVSKSLTSWSISSCVCTLFSFSFWVSPSLEGSGWDTASPTSSLTVVDSSSTTVSVLGFLLASFLLFISSSVSALATGFLAASIAFLLKASNLLSMSAICCSLPLTVAGSFPAISVSNLCLLSSKPNAIFFCAVL